MRGLRRSLLTRSADTRLLQRTAPGVAQHHGADLEEFQPDRANIGAGQFTVGQGNSEDRIQQHPVLIGPPFVATGAVGEQVQLKQIPSLISSFSH